MNYDKLRGRIREKFRTDGAFAKALGMREATLSRKLNGRSEWDRPQMEAACRLLDVPVTELHVYFF